MPHQFDVLIIGGGPAGTSAAIMLARSGFKVAILERSHYEDVRVGETLPPDVKPLLTELHLWDRFIDDQHTSSPGNVSVWGTEMPYENDFIFNPYGCGWHVDRRKFDQMLAQAAKDAGARVHVSARLKNCLQDGAGRWHLNALIDNARMRLSADYLVEATGRNSLPVSHSQSKRLTLDRLVGIVALMTPPESHPQNDSRTLIEASENGWWYSAWLPNAQLLVAYMTDHELLGPTRAGNAEGWQQLLRQAPTRKNGLRVVTSVLTGVSSRLTPTAVSIFQARTTSSSGMPPPQSIRSRGKVSKEPLRAV